MLNNSNRYTHAEEEEVLCDDWDARIENAQLRAFKRKHAAAMAEPDTAKRAALWAQFDAPRGHWFNPNLESSVTAQAPLVIKCLDDVRARARRPLAPRMLPLLLRGILESASLAPYLERWRCAPAPETGARCAYPAMD
jgi:hypothetical protein